MDLAWQRVGARRWLGVAVGSLVLAGALASLLVVGRAPGLDRLFSDPLFFRRALVVHVDLSLVVWFLSFVAALYHLIPTRRRTPWRGRLGLGAAIAGIAMLVLAAGMGGAPVLCNYVPVLDHPLFIAGLITFAVGLALTILQPMLSPADELAAGPVQLPAAARPGLRAAGLAVLLAMATFTAAWRTTPGDLPTEAYWELVMWGGGHVLQFASVAAMLAVWIMLLEPVCGQPVVSRRVAGGLFGLLLAPLLVAPLLAVPDTTASIYRLGFTRLMELGIFPVVLTFLVLCVRALVQARRAGRLVRPLADPRFVGFTASATLTVIGFGLGGLIDGSNTLVPGHYHASIGAVTVSFVTVAYTLLEPLGMRLGRRGLRLSRLQPVLFGAGQTVFAIGFAIAGAHGMGRKTYAAEQADHGMQTVGLVVMSVGGLVAVAGGLLFLALIAGAWRRRPLPSAHEENIDVGRSREAASAAAAAR
jgi:cytochrome c oxidase subunit 1